jgi:hypothetical protein
MPSFTKGLIELEEIVVRDPRAIDDYAANPFGILVYDPAEEFLLRAALDGFAQRLKGQRHVKVVSLAELFRQVLDKQLAQEGIDYDELFELEREQGFEEIASQLTALMDASESLVLAIADEAKELDEKKDLLLLVRAGILYPFYRVSPLLESLARYSRVPTVLCYPGRREGQTGLHFLNHQEALRGYRQRIF